MAEELGQTQTPAQRETKLADDYLKSATLARNVAHQALEKTLQELEAGTLRDPAKAAVNAATAGGIMLDKRLILEGRPTQILATEDPKHSAQRLGRRLGVVLETTASDVEPPQLEAPKASSVPLPSRSVAAKRAHAHAKTEPAD